MFRSTHTIAHPFAFVNGANCPLPICGLQTPRGQSCRAVVRGSSLHCGGELGLRLGDYGSKIRAPHGDCSTWGTIPCWGSLTNAVEAEDSAWRPWVYHNGSRSRAFGVATARFLCLQYSLSPTSGLRKRRCGPMSAIADIPEHDQLHQRYIVADVSQDTLPILPLDLTHATPQHLGSCYSARTMPCERTRPSLH